jgi:hypothetical protein
LVHRRSRGSQDSGHQHLRMLQQGQRHSDCPCHPLSLGSQTLPKHHK